MIESIDRPDQAPTISRLAGYYVRVADWVLPLLHDRPVSLVRAPESIEGGAILSAQRC
ncbi:hypothetical protein [Pseudomonas sp. Marseille-Q5117]|uniref:non-homologous end-joining DNA ligase LigD n=1 Tax=Pseudomonas sp. Marseille-Q5117 TaxID=2972777 RepID=UPI003966EEA1